MATPDYREPCITMHQPWASLLVHGIKRIEGRSWPSPITGRLWIHAASKVPDAETIQAMEHFYKEIYAVDGVTDIKFPEHYPVSVLLGCVNVVGCSKLEDLVCCEELPKRVRLEGQTRYCWLCEDPWKLIVPFEMRGWQGVYNLDKKIAEPANRGLRRVQGPAPFKFPRGVFSDTSSLNEGGKAASKSSEKSTTINMSPSLRASIAGARAAAPQFSRKSPAQSQHYLNVSSSYRR